MSALVHGALSVTPPVQGANIMVLATTASSSAKRIPESWRNAYWTVQADGDYVYIAFGDSSVAVDETAVTTLDADGDDPTFDGNECEKIESGLSKDFDLREMSKSHTHFAVKSAGTTGYIRITRSSGRV